MPPKSDQLQISGCTQIQTVGTIRSSNTHTGERCRVAMPVCVSSASVSVSVSVSVSLSASHASERLEVGEQFRSNWRIDDVV